MFVCVCVCVCLFMKTTLLRNASPNENQREIKGVCGQIFCVFVTRQSVSRADVSQSRLIFYDFGEFCVRVRARVTRFEKGGEKSRKRNFFCFLFVRD